MNTNLQKHLYNITAFDIFIADAGVLIAPGIPYIIPKQEYGIWMESQDIVPLILNGNISVFDSELFLTPRYGYGLIKENHVLINEFYTLVSDDSVLIGHGEILNIFEGIL